MKRLLENILIAMAIIAGSALFIYVCVWLCQIVDTFTVILFVLFVWLVFMVDVARLYLRS